MKRLLQIFPVLSSSKKDILKRNQIQLSFNKKLAQSIYTENQMLGFGDEALGQVYFDTPAIITSAVSLDTGSSTLQLIINERLEMQVNKLSQEGLNRSAFQIVKKITFQPDLVITVLEDRVAPTNITNLVVYLNKDDLKRVSKVDTDKLVQFASYPVKTFKTFPLRSLDEIDCCDGLLGGDGKWLVYKRKGDPEEPNGCTCNVRRGHCGFRDEWEVMQDGFDTEDAANAWIRFSSRCNH